MKFKLEIEGDYFEDKADLQTFLLCHEYAACIHEVREKIRHRLKYDEDVSEKEEQFLESLRSLTFIELE